MGIVLFFVALVLAVILYPIGILYTFIIDIGRFKIKTYFQKINKYFLIMAVSIDQTGNVFLSELFNHMLIKNSKNKFGNPDETISSVLGKNQLNNTLTFIGRCLNNLLNFIQPNHSVNSIEIDP